MEQIIKLHGNLTISCDWVFFLTFFRKRINWYGKQKDLAGLFNARCTSIELRYPGVLRCYWLRKWIQMHIRVIFMFVAVSKVFLLDQNCPHLRALKGALAELQDLHLVLRKKLLLKAEIYPILARTSCFKSNLTRKITDPYHQPCLSFCGVERFQKGSSQTHTFLWRSELDSAYPNPVQEKEISAMTCMLTLLLLRKLVENGLL